MEANVGPNRAVVGMRFLVRMHVEQADGSVSFKATFLTEDQQSTRATDLQVVRQQEGDSLANQRAGHNVCLHVTQLQGPGTKLHTDGDAFNPQLSKDKKSCESNKVKNVDRRISLSRQR